MTYRLSKALLVQAVRIDALLQNAATLFISMSSPEATVMRKQGLQHTTEEPLLLSLLHRYMAHGDPVLSPRIAAKAKSSIAAKPGGEMLQKVVLRLPR